MGSMEGGRGRGHREVGDVNGGGGGVVRVQGYTVDVRDVRCRWVGEDSSCEICAAGTRGRLKRQMSQCGPEERGSKFRKVEATTAQFGSFLESTPA